MTWSGRRDVPEGFSVHPGRCSYADGVLRVPLPCGIVHTDDGYCGLVVQIHDRSVEAPVPDAALYRDQLVVHC